MKPRKPRPVHPASFQVTADRGGSTDCVAGPFDSLEAAEAALLAAVLTAGAPLYVQCVETGRRLEDFDHPAGRAYLTARDQHGRAIRSKRYSTDDERADALRVMRWALSDPALTVSEFDPRKAP